MPKSVKSLTKTTKSGTTTRMKDGKETRQLFETIAKKLLNQQTAKNKLEMEVFCEDLLNKHMSELRRDLINIESALSSRITNVEAKYTVLENRLHETAANLTSKCDTIIADNQKAIDQTNAAIETERIKRLESNKKQSIKSDRVADEIKKLIEDTRADLFIETNNIQQDINLHTIEINRIKDNVEELLLKKYGFIPGTKSSAENLSASFNQGLDAGFVLDTLSNRMKSLELQIMNHDSDPMSASPTIRSPRSNRSPRDYRSPGRESPTRDRAYKSKSEKYIEDSIDDLRSQVVQCEAEIDHLKQAFRSKNRGKPSSVEGNFDEVNHHSLQRKVKKLAENTTKACGTLSAGLSDVQQATLNLYSWADKVHDSFQLVSDKLQLSSNICPRAKVYKPRGISAEGNY